MGRTSALPILRKLTRHELDRIEETWRFWARREQLAPEGDWRIWLFLGWRFAAPFEGLSAYVADEGVMLVCTASGWADWASILDLQNLPLLGVNTTADAGNKLAAKSSAILFDNIGNGVQLKLNKQASGDTGSLLFQTNYSGRAEMGLAGDDDFRIKVSADGASWTDALTVDRTTGNIGFGTSPSSLALDTFRASGYCSGRFKSADAASGAALVILNDTGSEVSFYNFGSGNGSSYAGMSSNNLAMFYYTGSRGLLFNNTQAKPIAFATGGTPRLTVTGLGNLLVGAASEDATARNVIGIADGTAPAASPAGTGQLYVEGGALKYRGSGGTVTVLAPA